MFLKSCKEMESKGSFNFLYSSDRTALRVTNWANIIICQLLFFRLFAVLTAYKGTYTLYFQYGVDYVRGAYKFRIYRPPLMMLHVLHNEFRRRNRSHAIRSTQGINRPHLCVSEHPFLSVRRIARSDEQKASTRR